MTKHTPVLIIGAGPVGLAIAGDLGWRGRDCWLVERGDGSVSQPKMDMVGVRTMEFARRWGIADWVRNSPYPRDYPQDNVYLESLIGFEFGREVIPCKDEELKPVQSPEKRERCPQDMFDPILQRWVKQYSSVTHSFRTELVGFTEYEDRVAAQLRDLKTGEISDITADFLIGADGGASFVRDSVGIRMEGTPVLTHTTNIIFHCADLPTLHDKKKAYRFIFIGPEGTWLTIVAINGADRWRMSIVGTETHTTYGEAEIRKLIVRAMGKPFDFEIESVMPWVRRELVADHYGTKRVFIAGDSAHLMSPTGGFGMNTGIGDAVDLGWKLDAVLQGWGGADLLRSYEMERRPVAQRNVAESSTNLKLMLEPRKTPPPAEIFMPGAEHDAARAAYGQWYGDLMKREWYTIGVHLGYRYENSPVIVSDGTPPPPLLTAEYHPTSWPGSRAPHVWLRDGRSSLDLFGVGYVLVRLGADAPSGEALEAAAKTAAVPFEIVTLEEPEAIAAFERKLVLVRPDGHVCWRGNEEPADATDVIDTVRGMKAVANAEMATA